MGCREEEKINKELNEQENKEGDEQEEEAPWPDMKTPSRYVQKNHPEEIILGNENVGV